MRRLIRMREEGGSARPPPVYHAPMDPKAPAAAALLALLAAAAAPSPAAQERGQRGHWRELAAADQTYADRAIEVGRNRAFLEFLGEGSVVFRDGPVDAMALYSSPSFSGAELTWESHYIDVSRAGDLGLSAGPLTLINPNPESGQDFFGHLVSVWKKAGRDWKLAADIAVFIPGFLGLEVEPVFEDALRAFAETAPAEETAGNAPAGLAAADRRFGRAINIRGGERALLRHGMESIRVYLPGMGPAVGADIAGSVYGAFLDELLSPATPVVMDHMGGYLSASKEMGYTYGVLTTNPEEAQPGFRSNYLRLWRFARSGEWRIAVEVLRPIQ